MTPTPPFDAIEKLMNDAIFSPVAASKAATKVDIAAVRAWLTLARQATPALSETEWKALEDYVHYTKNIGGLGMIGTELAALSKLCASRDVGSEPKTPNGRTTADAIGETEHLLAETFNKLDPDNTHDSWLMVRLTKIREALADRPPSRSGGEDAGRGR